MYDRNHSSKIKNDKIQRWRLELASYSFDIIYPPGSDDITADTFSRVICSAMTLTELQKIHNSLCHPGVTRLAHFVRSKNLPFSIDDIKRVVSSCQVCAKCKPEFFKPDSAHLIKATQPMKRINIDFKGPLPSDTANKYLLTAVDEYSRYPFAIPVADISSPTVIKSLSSIFSVFGLADYVHSDRGKSFMSDDFKSFLTARSIATSRTTPYNPQGNGQCERFNGTLWKAVEAACESRGIDIKHWEQVLPDALHSIHSLLCTATNCTPHERMFSFPRRSTVGYSMTTWLLAPGPVFLKKSVKSSKYDPSLEEIKLLESNPHYAHIRYSNGREDTVSLKNLSPYVKPVEPVPVEAEPAIPTHRESNNDNTNFVALPEATLLQDIDEDCQDTSSTLRQSTRLRKPPPVFDL